MFLPNELLQIPAPFNNLAGRWIDSDEGASPGSGAATDELRSPRPNSAQPSGRRFFSAPAALLAPYRSPWDMLVCPCGSTSRLAGAENSSPQTSPNLRS